MSKRVPVSVRLTAYLTAIFRKGMYCYTINFDKLAKSFGCTRRTVENAVCDVRKSGDFDFKTIRVGRSFAVQVSDRNHYTKGVFPSEKKEINNTGLRPDFSRNSSKWVSKPPPAKILALAAFLARNVLGKAHRAASRTMFRFAHAFNFCRDALHAGFDRDDIADAYRYALRNIDEDLGDLPPAVRWEPSSLVNLARRRLADGMDAAARVRIRRAALRKADAVKPVIPVTAQEPVTETVSGIDPVFSSELARLMARYA